MRPSADAGILRGVGILAGLDHGGGTLQESFRIETHRGVGHEAEIGKSGIAAADTRNAMIHAAEPERFRNTFQLRSGIGDRDEMVAGAIADGSSSFHRRSTACKYWAQA